VTAITIKQRTDHEITIEIPNEDLFGSNVKFIIAPSINDAPIVTLTSPSDIDMSGADDGIIVITIPKSLTDFRGPHYYECEVTGAYANRSVVASGTLTFKPTSTGY